MTAAVEAALNAVLGGVATLNGAAGAGRAFELLIMTQIGVGLKTAGFTVWLQRSDGTVIYNTDPDTAFIQRGGAPTGVPKASDGPSNGSVIGFRFGSGQTWEIWNGIQFQGRSSAKHEFDLAIVPAEVGAAMRITGGAPTGRPRVAIECKDVTEKGSLDEMRAFVARLYDTTLLSWHHPYLPFQEERALHPQSPNTAINHAPGSFKNENDRTRSVLARRTGFKSGTPPLAHYYRIEPHACISAGSAELTALVASVVDWALVFGR